jgi:hypothetical protein
VRKPWAPGAKNADKTLAPADETDGAHDPVLEAFNALAATDPDGEAAAAEESQEASAEDAPAATAVAVAEPEAPTVEPDPPAAEEPSPPAEAAPPAPAAAAPPIPVASAAMPEGSWNPEPVRGPGRAGKAVEALRVQLQGATILLERLLRSLQFQQQVPRPLVRRDRRRRCDRMLGRVAFEFSGRTQQRDGAGVRPA